jgi:hypothetical protein
MQYTAVARIPTAASHPLSLLSLQRDSLVSNAARSEPAAPDTILARAHLLDALNIPASWPRFPKDTR